MYGIWIVAGTLAFAAALLWREGVDKKQALMTALMALGAGLASAKMGYVLMFLNDTLFCDGLLSFFDFRAKGFCYFFGMIGAFGGVWLSARMLKLPVKRWLNLAAPCVALLVAFLRAGEKQLGTIGVGGYVPQGSLLARFPFAVSNSYGEYLYAVFYLEAILALALAAALLLCRKSGWFDHGAKLCVFFYAVPQILSESLRARCLRWGFVRVEQLLCGLLMLGFMFDACRRMNGRMQSVCRWWRTVIAVLALACVGLLEYALDKTGIPVPICYAMMTVMLSLCGVMYVQALHKQCFHNNRNK